MDKKSFYERCEAGNVPLETCNTDAIDFGFFLAARYFFNSFSKYDPCSCVMKMLTIESLFPGLDIAVEMRRSLACIHEMRMSRRSLLRFSNPRCKRCSAIVTQDELYLLRLIQHARAGCGSKVAFSALLLCEGNATELVVAPAYGFASLVQILTVPVRD